MNKLNRTPIEQKLYPIEQKLYPAWTSWTTLLLYLYPAWTKADLLTSWTELQYTYVQLNKIVLNIQIHSEKWHEKFSIISALSMAFITKHSSTVTHFSNSSHKNCIHSDQLTLTSGSTCKLSSNRALNTSFAGQVVWSLNVWPQGPFLVEPELCFECRSLF